jgi:hypothetical protein
MSAAHLWPVHSLAKGRQTFDRLVPEAEKSRQRMSQGFALGRFGLFLGPKGSLRKRVRRDALLTVAGEPVV